MPGEHPSSPNSATTSDQATIFTKAGIEILMQAGIWPYFVASIAAVLAAQYLAVMCWLYPKLSYLPLLLVLNLGVVFLSLVLVLWHLHTGLLRPLQILEDKVTKICQDNSATWLQADEIGGLRNFAEAIQNLNDELLDLYEDMDGRVAQQTKRLAQKSASLKILYEVAASINQAEDLTTLLIRYLKVFKDMANGRAATLQLFTITGRKRLIACIDSEERVRQINELLPLPLCRCGRVLLPGEILCEFKLAYGCASQCAGVMRGPHEVELLEIPLQYNQERLGVYRIWVDSFGGRAASREDVRELLATIGHHFGVAIAKQRSDAQAHQVSIMEERNHLAHELHDSLAQTLASLRLRIRMLQDSIQQNVAHQAILRETQQVKTVVDDAYNELRELLGSFRSPIGTQTADASVRGGLILALEKITNKFQEETAIAIFLQVNCWHDYLSLHEETQILRVVQESLANIRKHAAAHTVRVLLHCQPPGNYLLLVEDDGVGFQYTGNDNNSNSPALSAYGEHLGLAIMAERASRIGATLRIESEPGEGTRVELLFKSSRHSHAISAC